MLVTKSRICIETSKNVMERKEFFTMAQKATVFTANFAKLPAEPIAEVIVEHNEIKHYPQALQVGYNEKGEVVNTAILHDLHQNSVTLARLENVLVQNA